ncbi:exopolysaccharide biosynthesis polyprenyl glycosylphosphotransferase [Rufibacter radiotolerans]|uniref:exopolysaccharide biosynthesis polyprenyl glycosylphosphotransferase n=1 Tax=Rufibacter radiotolerans TaxID=1379910 RepID=UPI00069F3E9A|nr:exopolysaccharide biosynthesis polyprenyl glycosylphosphotransferase [Rufibacter radiotolerans]
MEHLIHKRPPSFSGRHLITITLLFLLTLYFLENTGKQEPAWFILANLAFLGILADQCLDLYKSYTGRIINSKTQRKKIRYSILIALTLLTYSLFAFAVPIINSAVAFSISLVIASVFNNLIFLNLNGSTGGTAWPREDTSFTRSFNFTPSTPDPAPDGKEDPQPKDSPTLGQPVKKGNKKYTLIAGVGAIAKNIEEHYYEDHDPDYQIKGFVQCKKEECQVKNEKVVGNLKGMKEYLRDNPVDEIVIALPVKPSKKMKSILEAADYHGIRVKYIPDYESVFGKNYKIKRHGNMDVLHVRQLPLDETFAFLLKNSFDKIFATFALLLLSPVFLTIALLIKLDSPGPVFYCPIRIGKSGAPFKVFKFRSMRENDSAAGGTLSTQVDDCRITPIGKVLRKYSLDELPQFINVLIGNMSVVGPRPHRTFLNQQFQETEDKYMVRHYFKPGITGWAQVNGWRGPTDTKEQKTQRTAHDLWYVENWSLWLDIKIIYLTIFSRKVHTTAF